MQRSVIAQHLSLHLFFACFYIICVCLSQIRRITFYIWCPSPFIQTGLGDPSSDVPSSSTSVLVLMGTDLPNVFLLLCSVIPMSASVIKFRGRKD